MTASGSELFRRFIQIGSMAGLTMNLSAGILRGNGITISGIGIGFGRVPSEVLMRTRIEALPRPFAMIAAEPSGTRVVLTP